MPHPTKQLKLLHAVMPAAIFILFGVVSFAQEQPASGHESMHHAGAATALQLTHTVAIAAEAGRPVYKPARCDAGGNVYFRAYQPDDRKVPVVRADARGRTTRYSLDSDPNLAAATAYDFSVLPNGDMYQPVQLGKDVYIVAFSKQGGIRWKARLEKQFWVSRLIAFNDQSFLVVGTEPQSQNGGTEARRYEPVIAIFDRNGRLGRNITLGGDAPAEAKGNQVDENPKAGPPMLALLGSAGEVGGDGKVYLLVPEPPAVYVIDHSGSVVRSWNVKPPDARMAIVSMSIDKDKLAILFRHSFQGMSHGEDTISVFDLSRGKEIERLSAAAELGDVLACVRSNDFLFIGSEPSSLSIRHSSAHKPHP